MEIFHKGKRVAVHASSAANRRHTTLADHMPSSHRRYAEWTPEHPQRRADKIGPNASALVAVILRPARSYGERHLDPACFAVR